MTRNLPACTVLMSDWVASVKPAKGFEDQPLYTLSLTQQARHARRVGGRRIGKCIKVPPGAKDPRVKPGVRR